MGPGPGDDGALPLLIGLKAKGLYTGAHLHALTFQAAQKKGPGQGVQIAANLGPALDYRGAHPPLAQVLGRLQAHRARADDKSPRRGAHRRQHAALLRRPGACRSPT